MQGPSRLKRAKGAIRYYSALSLTDAESVRQSHRRGCVIGAPQSTPSRQIYNTARTPLFRAPRQIYRARAASSTASA